MLTKEQLLIPRVRVKGYYPNSPFKDGEILTQIELFGGWVDACPDYWNIDKAEYVSQSDVEKSPIIFEKVHWWEERAVADMPMYLKDNVSDEVLKAKQWHIKTYLLFFTTQDCTNIFYKKVSWLNPNAFTPAAEQEYLEYLNGKK